MCGTDCNDGERRRTAGTCQCGQREGQSMKEVQTYQAHNNKGILLNANEMSENLSEDLRQKIAQAMLEIEFNRYPDDTCMPLRQAYGKWMNLDAGQILCGNGSDQMLGLMIGSFLGYGKTLYTLDPDFSMYDYYASSYEANVVKFQISPGSALNIDAFIAYGKAIQPNMILFSNPNNPTGMVVKKEDVKKILEAFDSIPVVMDEAYMEFGDESMIDEIENYPNLYVTRTLSKAYGLAGLRLGFLISSKANIDALLPKKVVYAVGSVTQKIGEVILANADGFQESIAKTKELRDELIKKCVDFKSMKVYDSKANFVLVRAKNIADLTEAFQKEGIVIRDYKGKDYIRITIGTKAQVEKVFEILSSFEKENA
jgi:histidinol-phosphate aminotransferase